ncbi:hypothetical protein D3C80_1303300 [compost metagenome]
MDLSPISASAFCMFFSRLSLSRYSPPMASSNSQLPATPRSPVKLVPSNCAACREVTRRPCSAWRAFGSRVPTATLRSSIVTCAARFNSSRLARVPLTSVSRTCSAVPWTQTLTTITLCASFGSSTARLSSPFWMIGRTLRRLDCDCCCNSSRLTCMRSRAWAIAALAVRCICRKWALCRA